MFLRTFRARPIIGRIGRARRGLDARRVETVARARSDVASTRRAPAQVAADGVARCKCDVRGLLVRDLAHASGSPALAFVTQGLAWRDGAPPPGDEEYFLRVAARLAPRRGAARGALAGAVEVGDAGLSLCEAALWRALAAADGARKGYAAARLCGLSLLYATWTLPRATRACFSTAGCYSPYV